DPGFIGHDFFSIMATDPLGLTKQGFAVVQVIPPGECPGDVTGDGVVDFQDLAIVLGFFGVDCNEPAEAHR
ncbi:MAG: hypothetical protein EA379_00015, partial [Phycisphaerales bacterium]